MKGTIQKIYRSPLSCRELERIDRPHREDRENGKIISFHPSARTRAMISKWQPRHGKKNCRINSPQAGRLINHYVCGTSAERAGEIENVQAVLGVRAATINYRKRMADQLPRKAFESGHKERRIYSSHDPVSEGGRQEAFNKIPLCSIPIKMSTR